MPRSTSKRSMDALAELKIERRRGVRRRKYQTAVRRQARDQSKVAQGSQCSPGLREAADSTWKCEPRTTAAIRKPRIGAPLRAAARFQAPQTGTNASLPRFLTPSRSRRSNLSVGDAESDRYRPRRRKGMSCLNRMMMLSRTSPLQTGSPRPANRVLLAPPATFWSSTIARPH